MSSVNLPTEIVLFGIIQLVTVASLFTAVKVDTIWIKKKLVSGDRRMSAMAKTIGRHTGEITLVKGICSARHGTKFPEVPENGDPQEDEGEE